MAVVLIVEDDLHVRFVADCALKIEGHKTIPVASLDEALTVLRSDTNIDALFTDINLDGNARAGLKVAKEAVRRRPGLGVIYTTGRKVPGPLMEGSAFLPKPYSSRDLTVAVERVLRKAKPRWRQKSFARKRTRSNN